MGMVTSGEHENNMVLAAYYREMEVYQYQMNIDNYAAMLGDLPTTDWPTHLVQYKTTLIESLPLNLDDNTVQIISDLQYRDRIRTLIRTEKSEQGKAGRVLGALKQRIGPNYETLVAAKKQAVLAAAATAQASGSNR